MVVGLSGQLSNRKLTEFKSRPGPALVMRSVSPAVFPAEADLGAVSQ